jgi:hypothetical protein
MAPLITIFTAPKPFTNPHIAVIQRNAIRSWQHLGDQAQVFLLGQEEGLAETAVELGVRHLPEVKRNSQGTPLVSSMFELARSCSESPFLACVNADVMLMSDFISVIEQVAEQVREFLVVGQRWDLDVREELDFSAGWEGRLRQDLRQRGRLHPPAGSDYFIFPRLCFQNMPRFAIGRAGWDNWMFFHARQAGWSVIDATGSLTVIHQDHDYSHLPNGQPHYRHPETTENIRLAGGRRSIFTLQDADYTLTEGRLHRIPLKGKKLIRHLETFPLTKLRSRLLGEVAFAIFHPVKAWGEWRGRILYQLRKR